MRCVVRGAKKSTHEQHKTTCKNEWRKNLDNERTKRVKTFAPTLKYMFYINILCVWIMPLCGACCAKMVISNSWRYLMLFDGATAKKIERERVCVQYEYCDVVRCLLIVQWKKPLMAGKRDNEPFIEIKQLKIRFDKTFRHFAVSLLLLVLLLNFFFISVQTKIDKCGVTSKQRWNVTRCCCLFVCLWVYFGPFQKDFIQVCPPFFRFRASFCNFSTIQATIPRIFVMLKVKFSYMLFFCWDFRPVRHFCRSIRIKWIIIGNILSISFQWQLIDILNGVNLRWMLALFQFCVTINYTNSVLSVFVVSSELVPTYTFASSFGVCASFEIYENFIFIRGVRYNINIDEVSPY